MSYFKQQILLLGAIKFSKQQFSDLPFLGKLDFFSKWLNPNFPILDSNQSMQISAYKPNINKMLKCWAYVSKKVILQKHSSELQSFRINLEKSMIKSLEELTNDKEKLTYAKMLKEVVSRAGLYQDITAVTTPEPQIQQIVNKHIQSQRLRILDEYKRSFDGFGLKLKASLLKLFSRRNIPIIYTNTKMIRWVNKVSAELLQLSDKSKQEKFLENIFSSYENDVLNTYISSRKRALFNRWNLKSHEVAPSRKTASRRLF